LHVVSIMSFELYVHFLIALYVHHFQGARPSLIISRMAAFRGSSVR
jgi:hypothetical protein